MLLTSEKALVFSILDTIEYMLDLDSQLQLDGEESFRYLIEINGALDHLDRL